MDNSNMEKSLNSTPVASRTHIGFFGRMNAGKSSLINALADQSVSIVSEEAGTTTDVVKKTMEIHGIGPCVLLDTAGFDDKSTLGSKRTQASAKAALTTDIAVLVIDPLNQMDFEYEKEWTGRFSKSGTPVVAVVSHADMLNDEQQRKIAAAIKEQLGIDPLPVSSLSGSGIEDLKKALVEAGGRMEEKPFIMGNLVKEGDVIILVMPQDPQAPQGRLILPEVQTIRECLDRHCTALCVQPENLQNALKVLKNPPDLIITDSQVFDKVYALKPEETRLTSFSVLFAGYKGDIDYYMKSVRTIDSLTSGSKVLIAECCTHAPLDEDIGRVKIPAMLKKDR